MTPVCPSKPTTNIKVAMKCSYLTQLFTTDLLIIRQANSISPNKAISLISSIDNIASSQDKPFHRLQQILSSWLCLCCPLCSIFFSTSSFMKLTIRLCTSLLHCETLRLYLYVDTYLTLLFTWNAT